MRAHGQTKLGFYPLPPAEANRLRSWLNFQEPFSTLDPCAGVGVAFVHLLRNAPARRYGIEIDAYRAEQARTLEIETLQANTMDVRCPADSLSFYTSILPTTGKPVPRTTKDSKLSFWTTRIAGSSRAAFCSL